MPASRPGSNKMSDSGFDKGKLPGLLNADNNRIELARNRQAAVWNGEKPDAWPILISDILTEEQEQIPSANYEEAFYDEDRMLFSQVRLACMVNNARSDAVPSIRPNLGTGVTLSCLGLEQMVFTDKMPWLQEHLTRKEVSRLSPEDIKIQGDFERGLRYIRHFKDVMGDSVPVYCFDNQGPLDLAHLIIGDDIFLAFHDDPPFVHHLMEIALAIDIKTYTWMKEAIGEQPDRLHHSNGLYAENMGVRICEDTSAIIGPDALREFAMPYTRRLAQHFGGAYVHYCGRNDHLTLDVLQIPEIKSINFGQIPGHDDIHDFDEEMERCVKYGKVYQGPWPRRRGESGREYLKRMHRWASEGVLVPRGDAAVSKPSLRSLTKGEQERDLSVNVADLFPNTAEALDFWYSLG